MTQPTPRPNRAWKHFLDAASKTALLLLLATAVDGCHSGSKPDSSALSSNSLASLPRSPAELNASYAEPPPGQNAATFHLQGFEALRLANLSPSNLPLLGKAAMPPAGSAIPPAVKAAMRGVVDLNREALRFFAQGAAYEKSRYPIDLTRGFEATLPHLAKIKNAARLAELAATVDADNGEANQAAADVMIGLGLARSLQNEPTLISQLVRVAAVSASVAALEQTVNRIALAGESVAALSGALQKMEDADAGGHPFTRALSSESVSAAALFEHPAKLLELLPVLGTDIAADEKGQITTAAQNHQVLKEEKDFYDETLQQLITARAALFPGRLRMDDLLTQRVSKAKAKNLALVAWLLKGMSGCVAREAASLASLRLAITALALEQFRSGHNNQYPDSLAKLTPEYLRAIPVDPFDGQPLRYQKTEQGGFLLYSVGPDLVDDSGHPMQEGKGDISFALTHPAKSSK